MIYDWNEVQEIAVEWTQASHAARVVLHSNLCLLINRNIS